MTRSKSTRGQKLTRGYGRNRLELPPLVVTQILNSRYAKLVARQESVRMALFPQIVSLHTERDLCRLEGLNSSLIRKIEVWLIYHGTRLRKPRECINAVICNFKPKGWFRRSIASKTPPRRNAGAEYRGSGYLPISSVRLPTPPASEANSVNSKPAVVH